MSYYDIYKTAMAMIAENDSTAIEDNLKERSVTLINAGVLEFFELNKMLEKRENFDSISLGEDMSAPFTLNWRLFIPICYYLAAKLTADENPALSTTLSSCCQNALAGVREQLPSTVEAIEDIY